MADIIEVTIKSSIFFMVIILICICGSNVKEITNELQNIINEINLWITNNGLEFSTIKTTLLINEQHTKFTKCHTFLQVKLDRRIDWKTHTYCKCFKNTYAIICEVHIETLL